MTHWHDRFVPRSNLRPLTGCLPCRQYIEKFDQAQLVETARLVSAEGAALVESQTTALFGDVKQLQRQMMVRARQSC